MDRRAFLQTLMAAGAGFALDPERLLWVPGQKTIFLPPVQQFRIEPEWLTNAMLKLMTNQRMFAERTHRRYHDEYADEVNYAIKVWKLAKGD